MPRRLYVNFALLAVCAAYVIYGVANDAPGASVIGVALSFVSMSGVTWLAWRTHRTEAASLD